MPSLSPDQFKNALSHFASGVTVVTFKGNDGYGGVTVSSFSSVSLDPPLISVCLEKTINSHDAIKAANAFVVNILSQGQEEASNGFASSTKDKNDLIESHGYEIRQSGAPLLSHCLANLECQIVDFVSAGDHSIVIGEVVYAKSDDEKRPLLYYRRNYYGI